MRSTLPRNDIIDVPYKNVVDEVRSDAVCGCIVYDDDDDDVVPSNNDTALNHLTISFQAYLHVDVLLSEILQCRKNISVASNKQYE